MAEVVSSITVLFDAPFRIAIYERGAEIFGDNQAKEISHVKRLKTDGIKYCDCPARKAAQDIIAKKMKYWSNDYEIQKNYSVFVNTALHIYYILWLQYE